MSFTTSAPLHAWRWSDYRSSHDLESEVLFGNYSSNEPI
jgi:hypothetical protein